MSADQEQLAAEILDGYTPIDDVPSEFEQYVLDCIAARPSPAPPAADPLAAIVDKLDEILTLLRGTPE